jgi:hypothetical protein
LLWGLIPKQKPSCGHATGLLDDGAGAMLDTDPTLEAFTSRQHIIQPLEGALIPIFDRNHTAHPEALDVAELKALHLTAIHRRSPLFEGRSRGDPRVGRRSARPS